MTEKELRHKRFNELLKKIPVSGVTQFRDAGQRLDWLEENLCCARSTARQWCMVKASRAIPASKLRIMERIMERILCSDTAG